MRKHRTRILLIAVLALVACGLGWVSYVSYEPPEPTYRGQKLSYWLMEFGNEIMSTNHRPFASPELKAAPYALAAMHESGTNALPLLLRLTAAKDSPIKLKMYSLINKLPFFRFRLRTSHECHVAAQMGFILFEQDARPAVPKLAALLDDPDPDVRRTAAAALGYIRPPATDAIYSFSEDLNDPNSKASDEAVFAIFGNASGR